MGRWSQRGLDRYPGEPRVGVVSGTVTKRAAWLRVVFRTGHPLELVPVEAGDRFPVNFYAGLYRQLEPDERRSGWPVVGVVAYDKAGRRVAQYQHGRS
jgi:hypothetical protein